MTTAEILKLIQTDPGRREVLRAAQSLNLPDWLIGAGFVRNPVWDYLHGYTVPTPRTDVDVVYFDPAHVDETIEKEYERRLRNMVDADWSVTNQARMARINQQPREYTSTSDALAHWTETATAIGVRIDDTGILDLVAPYGIDDLVSLKIRMTPNFSQGFEIIKSRVEKKGWLKTWPKLILITP